MSLHRVWKRVLGVEHTVIESVALEGAEGVEAVVAEVRPTASRLRWCSKCGRSCPGYDNGDGRRRWRAMDLGSVIVEVEADAPRVCCRFDGVVVAAVPWARTGSRFTTSFEQTGAWLTANASGSAVAELLGVAWRTVTAIVERVVADALAGSDRPERGDPAGEALQACEGTTLPPVRDL